MCVRLRLDLRAALALCAVALPLVAWADLSGMVEMGYGNSRTRSTDQAQLRTTTFDDQFTHRYRLSLDRRLFPKLSFNAGGSFEQALAPTGLSLFSNAPPGLWNLNATLGLSDTMYGVSANYVTSARGSPGTSNVRTESPSLHLYWRPTDLPAMALRFSQIRLFDPARVAMDRSTFTTQLSSTWAPVKSVDLGYHASFSTPEDRLTGVTTRDFNQGLRASWGSRIFSDRTTIATALNLSHRVSEVARAVPGGTTESLQAPVSGGTAIEELPATATDIALSANAALIDGNAGTTSGVNLGYGRSLAGDVRSRHLGLEFGDPLTKVNRIHVVLDRTLPPGVAGNFTWAAYKSEDGRLWTTVPIDGLVHFDEFYNRFEIPLALTETRHVKVVTRPLAAGVTLDSEFADILVTELQALHVTPLAPKGVTDSQADASATASARTRITDELSHDATVLASIGGGTALPGRTTWSVSNGLSWGRPLSEHLRAAARVARVDSDYGRGALGMFSYGASLTATPLPTLNHALVYGGQATTDAQKWATTNSVSLLNNLTPYRGISLMGSATWSFGMNAQGQAQTGESLILSSTLQPHARLTVTSTAAHSGSATRSGAITYRTRQNRVEGGVSFSPFNSLYLSGNLSWVVADREPVLLGSSSIAFSPFPGGALQLGVSYSQNLDASGAVGQYLSPSLRWTVRRGLQLNAAYTLYDSGRSIPETSIQSFSTTLQLVL